MQLTINRLPQTLIPIQQFRAEYHLPDSFGVNQFEPKDWTGLGSMAGAGATLQQLRHKLITAVPPKFPLAALFSVTEGLTVLFLDQLTAANAEIGLRSEEIDYAVAGFQDVLQTVAYRLVQLNHTRPRAQLDFDEVYQAWLNDSVRVAGPVHRYQAGGTTELGVRVISYAYGRIGLAVEIGPTVVYVLDSSLACPATGFMYELCHEVSAALNAAVS